MTWKIFGTKKQEIQEALTNAITRNFLVCILHQVSSAWTYHANKMGVESSMNEEIINFLPIARWPWGLTQPLTQLKTMNLPVGVASGRRATMTTTSPSASGLSRKVFGVWEPYRYPRYPTGIDWWGIRFYATLTRNRVPTGTELTSIDREAKRTNNNNYATNNSHIYWGFTTSSYSAYSLSCTSITKGPPMMSSDYNWECKNACLVPEPVREQNITLCKIKPTSCCG